MGALIMVLKHSYGFRRARARSKQAAALAKAQQDIGPESASEIARLNECIAELWVRARRLEAEIRGLRNELARSSREGGTGD
jgi:molecular chaperone GrpE (heat shock protein)